MKQLIFRKWCYVSNFGSKTISKVEVTERLAKNNFEFSRNTGMVYFENSNFGYKYSRVLNAGNRGIHTTRTQ